MSSLEKESTVREDSASPKHHQTKRKFLVSLLNSVFKVEILIKHYFKNGSERLFGFFSVSQSKLTFSFPRS